MNIKNYIFTIFLLCFNTTFAGLETGFKIGIGPDFEISESEISKYENQQIDFIAPIELFIGYYQNLGNSIGFSTGGQIFIANSLYHFKENKRTIEDLTLNNKKGNMQFEDINLSTIGFEGYLGFTSPYINIKGFIGIGKSLSFVKDNLFLELKKKYIQVKEQKSSNINEDIIKQYQNFDKYKKNLLKNRIGTDTEQENAININTSRYDNEQYGNYYDIVLTSGVDLSTPVLQYSNIDVSLGIGYKFKMSLYEGFLYRGNALYISNDILSDNNIKNSEDLETAYKFLDKIKDYDINHSLSIGISLRAVY